MHSQSRRRQISAVGFDFDHTLGIDNKLERVAFLRLLDAACEQGGRCMGTLAEEIVAIDALLADQRAGKCSIEAAVEDFMRARGASEPAGWVNRYKQMCIDMVETFVIPQPDAREVLRQLRERDVPCGILTNGWSPLQQRKAVRAGFEGLVLVSSDLGVQKPELASFIALAQALGVAKEQVAFVGDSPESDIAGSMLAGMMGVWLDAEGVIYPQSLPRPHEVIHTLAELLRFV